MATGADDGLAAAGAGGEAAADTADAAAAELVVCGRDGMVIGRPGGWPLDRDACDAEAPPLDRA
jgi:hypothetical protein